MNISDVKLRSKIRAMAGCRKGCGYPVFVVEGHKQPTLVGEPYHYQNKRGDIILHPNAYRRAWGKPIYIASTLHVEIGQVELESLLPQKE